ncbi:hypothetical protein K449DRAFT_76939 [Hypoxylon sp. EC38]|nr:hypothetical protein K449DRAFT_76939 [Hypoxylon sp. EC38]
MCSVSTATGTLNASLGRVCLFLTNRRTAKKLPSFPFFFKPSTFSKMAPETSVHRLRRSVSTTFAGVTPMFRRILRRRNSSNQHNQSASSLIDNESSRAQFDKRCVVTFESGRGTIRAVRNSFVPEAGIPGALDENLIQRESPAASLGEIRTLSPEFSDEPELAGYHHQSQLARDPQPTNEVDELKQQIRELSQKMDLVIEKLFEGFGRVEAQLNMLEALMHAREHSHGHSHRHH